ncbi:PHD finger protein 3 isoform X2 [Heteronotia binoei]|nr:PHD finger protein 3 isoform X2 [Heteronotia binoei]
MDEGVKETARSTIDEDDFSPNRNLRDQMDGASVKSPRKSPRLMTQEPVRSLRQSTLAKRSSALPSTNTKKSSVKPGAAQKAGLKQQDKGLIKPEDSSAPEHPKEVGHTSKEPCQEEKATEVSSTSDDSEWATCCATSEEVKMDSKHKIPHQASTDDAPHEQENSSQFPGTSSPIKEPGSEIEVVAGSDCDSVRLGVAALPQVETNQVQNNPVQKDGNETVANEIISEVSTKEKTDHKLVKELNKSITDSESNETEMVETPYVTTSHENASEAEETLTVESSFVDGKSDSSSDLKASGEVAHQISFPEDDKQEPSDGSEKDKMKNDPVDIVELDQTSSKITDAVSAKSVTPALESVQDIPVPIVQQQNDREQMGDHETAGLQKDNPSSTTSKCIKNVKPKHAKHKQNKATAVQQKLASINQEVHPKTEILHSHSSVSLKRNAEEQGSLQHFHKPAKVKKKHENKDLKAQSCDSGIALKKQPPGKNVPRAQIPAHVRKACTEKAMDNKSSSRQAGLKEGPSLVSGSVHPKQGQLPHNQKQPQKHPFLKTNNCVKEEGGVKKDSMGMPVDHLKEDEREKFKLRKLEKSLQPRQRRSSKSLSVDEPPLFIPDNISTIKRESSDNLSPSDSKSLWVPSKQCGFCKKPHGNRFMVGCGRCDDWFHGDCVGLSLFQAQQMGEEDKEYVCVKCCAEEDKKPDVLDQNILDTQVKQEPTRESRTMEYEKPGISKQTPTCPPNKTKVGEDNVKHKVKIFKRESGEGRAVSESKDSDVKKGAQIPIRKMGQMTAVPRRSSEEKQERNKDTLSVSCSSESTTKSGFQDRPEGKKKKTEKGGTASTVHLPPASKPSTDQIRQSVRQSLREILEKRLADSTLKIPEERAAKVAIKIEKELYSFFRDTDSKYKNKYRSLIFNLKDQKNNILFKRVLKGDVTPDHLIRMSPEELASKELAAWRKRENQHTIEMIEKEQREVERRPITKITHKGEIEIESETQVKEPEAVMEHQESVSVKVMEKMEETEKDKEVDESATPDTTSQHKHHLFDLNCKICIGRMAPPNDDLPGKNVKVSAGVARKPSDNEAESLADALSSTTNILASELLEEDIELPNLAHASAATPRSETPGTVESETLFLARLNFIWKGFINMPSVAKFVIKAYPISGSFENLTEDLPDSIQVGGRISPQTVWEYVEKIKATGTKEICVVRFTPVTEEDQISYTLLFAYFSSRKRYGVAANNMKQIKDLYIIPLGASDKIPHQLVPFDGPGIEVHRPNLLLGLIIRQKLKRQINAVANASTSHTEESLESSSISLPPEKKSKLSKPEVLHSEAIEKEEENDFFNSFTAVLHKQRLKSQQSSSEEVATSEPSVETIKHEPPKPLRFLPGVLVGWENQSSALDLVSKPLPVDDILQSLLGMTGQMPEHIQSTGDHPADENLPEKQADIKEEKMDIPVVTPELEEMKDSQGTSEESTENIAAADTLVVDVSCSSGNLTSLSLKGKPPDVSTEAFLANLAILSQNKETKEATESIVMLGDADNVSQEDKRTTSCPASFSLGKAGGSNNAAVASVDATAANNAKSPQFINLKRDPRQAAGRSQQSNTSEGEGDSVRNEDIQNNQQLDTSEIEETNVDNKQSSGNDPNLDQSNSQASKVTTASAATKADDVCPSQLEDANQSQEKALMQNIETVHSVRRGLLPPPPPPSSSSSQFETENSCHAEFSTKTGGPVTSGNFSPIRTQQPNFQHTKTAPPAFPFQGAVPPTFPLQNNPVFGFPPHLPPPLLPPPGFGFPQTPLIPWPPVMHLSGQPPHFVGPVPPAPPLVHKQSRFSGPEHFYQSRDNRRPERRHSDPWGRQGPHLERTFARKKSEQHRQRFYSESHHQKKGRHDWEPDSERNRHRDRTQDKERDRKSREEGHRDKERSRLSHSDKDSEGRSSRESRNPEKKDVPKSEERAHDKEREKSRERHRERDSEKNRDRHHKDRDHSDRSKSKR